MAARGPGDATIRRIPEADAEKAFAEHPEERAERGTGKGSVSGVRVGSPDAMGTLDVKAAQNLAARAARKGSGRTGAPPGKRLQAPAAAPPAQEFADWEQEAGTGAPGPAAVQVPALAVAPSPEPLAADPGDILERSKNAALKLLAQIPEGMELYVGSQLTQQGVELVMGLGYLVGKGLAHYRGNSHYRISNAGVAAFIEDKV